jgi:hypothetical protein
MHKNISRDSRIFYGIASFDGCCIIAKLKIGVYVNSYQMMSKEKMNEVIKK